MGNAASLDEDMVGMQLAFQGLTRSRRFPVQVLIAIAPFHRLHPRMVPPMSMVTSYWPEK
ncbi:MAG: hypothetical protein N838_09035 [Thiohalocapsa sp. PB-PSB1]|nr:MAG: hypothetical protein N838_09035 [Thiohalocapsa sp. PB-PSB1]